MTADRGRLEHEWMTCDGEPLVAKGATELEALQAVCAYCGRRGRGKNKAEPSLSPSGDSRE